MDMPTIVLFGEDSEGSGLRLIVTTIRLHERQQNTAMPLTLSHSAALARAVDKPNQFLVSLLRR